MFDFAWTEIALIGVVALVAIGPKDLPVAIKTVAGLVKKARRMAGEFQGHVDEMVREANLHEVRDQISQLRNFDIKSEIAKAVDSDGTLRATFADDPLKPSYTPSIEPAVAETATLEPQVEGRSIERPVETVVAPPDPAPAFIPPGSGGDYAPLPPPAPPPAFIPPVST
jgi:sec-independent protein translocase protein TatB